MNNPSQDLGVLHSGLDLLVGMAWSGHHYMLKDISL